MGALGIKAQVKRGISRRLLLVCSLLFSFSVFSMTKEEQSTITSIENRIQSGQLKQAEGLLQQIIHSNAGSLAARYTYQKLLSKVFLHQQIFDKYLKSCDQALKVARRLDPIYASEVYANKAYYWHYMMWSDSALVYSNKAMDLFRKNRSSMEKIDVPFMYEVYAITYLYRNDRIKPSAYLDVPIADFKRKQFQWFDSALYYQQKFPFKFTSDLSMLYRSYANRWLDVVSGEKRNPNSPLQIVAFNKANNLYDKGLACIKPWHLNDCLTLSGLKGAIHTYTKKYKEADEIFKHALNKVPRKTLFDRSKVAYQPLMVFLTFYTRNTLSLTYDSKSIDAQIAILRMLRPDFWRSFDAKNDLPYDPYRTSPYINLFSLYAIKSMHEANGKEDFSAAVSYLITLKSYFHFLKSWPDQTFQSIPFVHAAFIQKRLKKNECYLLMQSDNDLLDGKKILITRSKITFVNSNNSGCLNERNFDTLDFKTFRRMSYHDFSVNFSDVLRVFPKMKKVYISYDDKNPYEMMLKDTSASGFSNAQYLGNTINFVRVYNPITYFKGEKVLHPSRMDVRFLRQNDGTKLPFMNEFFDQFETRLDYSKSAYSGDLKKSLYPPGIFHLYGHGEFTMDEEANTPAFQLRYFLSNGATSERRLTGEFPVQRDLVVLNNCFSGLANFLVNEFNRSIPLRILSNGAKAVLVSPSKVDDYFSSEFFKVFYQKIAEGMLFEDAVFFAKNKFYRKHPSMRHPQYWEGFQLIQSYKLSYVPAVHKRDFPWWIFVLSGVVTAAGALLLRHSKIRPRSSKGS